MQADLCDIRQRNLRRAVELDGIAVKARELAHEELLALARRVERHVDFLALLAHEVARLAQDADFANALQNYAKQLQFQMQQDKNAVIGRIGAEPASGLASDSGLMGADMEAAR